MSKNIKNLLKSISIIHRMGHIFIDNKLKNTDISSGHFGYLLKIYKNEGLSQEDLTCYLSIDKSTTTKALKNLELKGYIKRKKDINDKRILRIYLTQKGKDLMPILLENLDNWKNIITKDIPEEQVDIIENILEKMISNAVYFNNNNKNNEKG